MEHEPTPASPEQSPYLPSFTRIEKELVSYFGQVQAALVASGTGITAEVLPDTDDGWALAEKLVATTRLRELEEEEEASRSKGPTPLGDVVWSGGSLERTLEEQAQATGKGLVALSRSEGWRFIEIHLPPGMTRGTYTGIADEVVTKIGQEHYRNQVT